MKTVKSGAVAKAHFRAGQIAKDRAIERRTAARRFGKSSGKIFYCAICGAPVVDSGLGRLAHARRQPRCREGMGV